MTAPETAGKKTRKPTAKAASENPNPEDFQQMVEETRRKMQGRQRPAADVVPEPEAAAVEAPTAQDFELVLPAAAPLAPGTLGIHALPLSQAVRSSCNVRNHYDPDAIAELAESLASEGQIENATGRWNAEGLVEIVAGESRRRAWALLAEAGRVGPAQPFLVNVRDLSDAEALSISATENMRRRSMTPLEECEAMQRLHQAGRTVEEIQAMFGFKTPQPVADRILVAEQLHTGPREQLDNGQLSLAAAMVIARAPGTDLQLSMAKDATGYRRASAKDLAEQLTRGQFLVKNAKFSPEKSGLEIKKDLFDAYEAYFQDKAAALAKQLEWAKARKEKLEAKGGKNTFVHVLTGQGEHFYRSDHKQYGYSGSKVGRIIYISTTTGAVIEEGGVHLKDSASVTTGKDGTAQAATKERELPDSAHFEAHKLRATAARASVLGENHLTLALTVWGLIIGTGDNAASRVHLMPPNEAHEIPDLKARTRDLNALLQGVGNGSEHVHISALQRSGTSLDKERLLRLLVAMTDEELLGHLNTLVAQTAYDWFRYSNKDAVRGEYAFLATLTDAPQRLAQAFTLTDEWLKRYPRADLLALAAEAGLDVDALGGLGTLKEMRGRIMEHAERLHEAGFVPALVRFPAPKASAEELAAQAAAAAQERADVLILIGELSAARVDEVLDDLGCEATDEESGRAMIREEVGRMSLEDLRDWPLLDQLRSEQATAGAAD